MMKSSLLAAAGMTVAALVSCLPAQGAATANPKLVPGIYVDRRSGTPAGGPHYFLLVTVKGAKVHGKLGFEGQDGTITTDHTFKGKQQYGLATLHFSNHKTLTATINSTKRFELDNCQQVMRFSTSRFPDCQFHKAKHVYS